MIATGDESARNAFRAILRDEPSRPNATQELDANDILEVRDLARAIERAEQMLTPLPVSTTPAAKSVRDIFDVLASEPAPKSEPASSPSSRVPTDDASGPALFAPSRPTPVPAPPPATLRSPLPTVNALVLPPITSASAPIVPAVDEDAYFQPGGRIRGLADESVQIRRPDATMVLRAYNRRKTATWVVGGVVGALAILAAAAMVMRPSTPEPEPTSTTTLTTALAAPPVTAAPVTTVVPAAAVTTARPPAAATTTAPIIPVFDVNSLPTAQKK